MDLTRPRVAASIDHTLLAPEATGADVAAAASIAVELGTRALCVSPSRIQEAVAGIAAARAAGVGEGAGRVPVVCSVVGFPSGAHHSLVKGAEARLAVDMGATEIDMVIDVGMAVAGDFSAVLADIVTVREAAPRPVLLKVILETAALSDAAIVACAEMCEAAGADFVKTSTGFHQAGGASVHAVELLARTVGGRLGVKASGGIRTAEAAREMLAAGATRLGLSGTRVVLDGFDA